jgi:hypothetical protein
MVNKRRKQVWKILIFLTFYCMHMKYSFIKWTFIVFIQVSTQRLIAYIKRLCTVALHQSTPTALALLSYARSFLQVSIHARKTFLETEFLKLLFYHTRLQFSIIAQIIHACARNSSTTTWALYIAQVVRALHRGIAGLIPARRPTLFEILPG